jgi:Protein of unknown function (DUF2764)
MAALHYILTALPALGDWGSIPPVTPARMLDYMNDNSLKTLLEAVFLSDDLLQHQAFLTGEMTKPSPVVLTESQVRNEQPVPEYLIRQESERSAKIPADALWAGYYRYADYMANNFKCRFLVDWLAYEVALRNALASARARALNLTPEDYLVVTELADREIDFTALLNEWTAALTPLEGLKILDHARWHWLQENDGWFTFQRDELLAYAAKLMLLHRWHRLRDTNENDSTVALKRVLQN